MKNLIYKLKRPLHFFKTGVLGGLPAQILTGFPQKKLKIIAITGTDGKTTTSSMVYQFLRQAGYKVGLISTVAAYIGEQKIDTGFHVTSPHPRPLYRFMQQMVAAKLEYLVLEVTSQGAYQYRTWGITPEIVGLTNLDFEHLDYHLNQENYLAAKALVFRGAAVAVLNQDQSTFPLFRRALDKKTKLITYSRETRFSAGVEKTLRATLPEDYNRLNAYLAITICKQIGINDKDIIAALENYTLPEGRMEIVPNQLGFTMLVDFAHTPQALEAALKNIRKNHLAPGKKLIGLVGCAGLRDYQKRPKMGRILAEKSDLAIFTAEDPRSENIWAIINQMKSNLGHYHSRVISIANRAQALEFAIRHYGNQGNTIAIFGKGHEQSINYDGKTETPWNDLLGSREIIKNLEKEILKENKK